MSETSQAGSLKALLVQGVEQLDLELVDAQFDRLIELVTLLSKWNRAYNLTAIRTPREMVIKHLLDSLSVAPFIERSRVIDVGTGGGFPGLPLAIARPKANFVLLDASNKKVRFVQRAIDALMLSNASAVHHRVEDYVEAPFDVVICRAFSNLNTIVELTQHLVGPGGRILAMKGHAMADAKDTVSAAGWRAEEQPVVVPLLAGRRHLVQITRAGNLDLNDKQD